MVVDIHYIWYKLNKIQNNYSVEKETKKKNSTGKPIIMFSLDESEGEGQKRRAQQEKSNLQEASSKVACGSLVSFNE